MINFLFWLFFIGLIIATIQDVKRREIDNWLNLLLILMSSVYFFFSEDLRYLLIFWVFLFVMYLISNLFYHAKVFAGGDAKLLFAMTALFMGTGLYDTSYNLLLFLVLLMVSGSVYGMVYSLVLYFKNFKEVNKSIRKMTKNKSFKYFFITGILFLAASYFNTIFLMFSFLALLFPILYVFAKGLEEVTMIRIVSGKDLREGDWILENVRVGKKVIKANWEGLTKNDLILLKNSKKVKIKDGIPFVPAFLMAFVLYSFYGSYLLTLCFNLF